MTGRPDCDVVSIDSGYSTPPALEGRSCVYVLRYSAFVRDAGWAFPPQGSSPRLSAAATPPQLSAAKAEAEAEVAIPVAAADVSADGSTSLGEGERGAGGGGGGEKGGGEGETPSLLTKPSVKSTKSSTKTTGPTDSMMTGGGGEGGMDGGGGGGGAREAGVWFYVGESDAIRERLRQHAKRWGGGAGSGSGLEAPPTAEGAPKRGGSGLGSSGGGGGGAGGACCKLDAVVVAMENRSEARRLETAVIRGMKEEGFYLVSDKDGSRTHFSSSS